MAHRSVTCYGVATQLGQTGRPNWAKVGPSEPRSNMEFTFMNRCALVSYEQLYNVIVRREMGKTRFFFISARNVYPRFECENIYEKFTRSANHYHPSPQIPIQSISTIRNQKARTQIDHRKRKSLSIENGKASKQSAVSPAQFESSRERPPETGSSPFPYSPHASPLVPVFGSGFLNLFFRFGVRNALMHAVSETSALNKLVNWSRCICARFLGCISMCRILNYYFALF